MIHRVVFGSIERFIGILIEHYAGKFPTWLAPIQAKVLPVSDKFADYAKQVAEALKASGVRVEVDDRDEKLGYKIRQAQLQKVPYMLILGEKEQSAGTVSVRKRDLIDENDSPELGAMSVENLPQLSKKNLSIKLLFDSLEKTDENKNIAPYKANVKISLRENACSAFSLASHYICYSLLFIFLCFGFSAVDAIVFWGGKGFGVRS